MKARLVWLVLCGIWGSTWLFIKLGLEDLPPITFAGIRFVIACAILFLIIRIRDIALPRARSDWILLAVTGILAFGLPVAVGLIFRFTRDSEVVVNGVVYENASGWLAVAGVLDGTSAAGKLTTRDLLALVGDEPLITTAVRRTVDDDLTN